jgi:HNH endonuclease
MRNCNVTREECLSWLGLRQGQPHSALLMRYMRETKEHLLKRSDGGSDSGSNIVLAHQYCNSSRGDRSPQQHRAWIRQLLAEGGHPLGQLRGRKKIK